jgi:hypothetical protein
MSNIEELIHKKSIIKKINAIESAFEDLSESEMAAVLCTAITETLCNREYCPPKIKHFYAEMAAAGIAKADLASFIFKEANSYDVH